MPRLPATNKLARPRIEQALPRPRLFRQLDHACRRGVAWVSGPPGAGKTTLVTSYLDHAGIPALWYRLDEDDADLATIFHYLTLAAPRGRRPLPAFAPEYRLNLTPFVRRFFADLFGRLKTPVALVFDNVHAVPDDALLHEVLAIAAQSLPPGVSLILISRSAPRGRFARLLANRQLALVDWEALRLTASEGRALLRLDADTHLPADAADRLYRASGGWPAGFVLLQEYARYGRPIPELDGSAVISPALFDYFAHEVFAVLDPETQRVLMEAATLQDVTAEQAAALTGNPRAGRMLAALAEHHFFIEYRPGKALHYGFHPLFHHFLEAQAGIAFSASRLTDIRQRAGQLLCASGEIEAAAQLYRAAGDWDSLAALILEKAPSLLGQGRSTTVNEWISALPAVQVAQAPWLLIWQATCAAAYDPEKARSLFERAYELSAEGDVPGRCLVWAGVVETYLNQQARYAPLDRWISEFDRLEAASATLPAEIQIRVLAAFFGALLFRQPTQPRLDRWARRLEEALQASPDPVARILSGSMLLLYAMVRGEMARAARIADLLAGPDEISKLPPLPALMYFVIQAAHAWLRLDIEASRRFTDRGLHLAQDSGVHLLDLFLHAQRVTVSLIAGDPVAAHPHMKAVRETIDPTQLAVYGDYYYLAAWLALTEGDAHTAANHARISVELVEQAGTVIYEGMCRAVYVHALCLSRDSRAAAAQHAALGRIVAETGFVTLEFHHKLLQGEIDLADGREAEGLAALSAAFALTQRHGFFVVSGLPAPRLAVLCARVLEADLQGDIVVELIRRRGLRPPDEAAGLERWPWPVKVYTLGRFAVLKDDKPLRFSGKAQHKPLELLQALVALGGRDVSVRKLTAALWSETGVAAPERALYAALHRLRKLLGSDAAVLLHANRVTLNESYVWVDVRAFEQVLNEIEGLLMQAPRVSTPVLARALDRALHAYAGPFLSDLDDVAWPLSLRERLRSRFLRLLAEVGHHWERAGERERAIGCYQRGLEIDVLAEELYRRLMICHRDAGQVAEALSVYRRCRHSLATLLGIAPGAETETLCRSLLPT